MEILYIKGRGGAISRPESSANVNPSGTAARISYFPSLPAHRTRFFRHGCETNRASKRAGQLVATRNRQAVNTCFSLVNGAWPTGHSFRANVGEGVFAQLSADHASCEAARRALLSQGYVIPESTPAFLPGRKKFQLDHEVHLEIEVSVVCASNSAGSNSTTVFANAVQKRYSLKKNSSATSIGVPALGSVSRPIGSSDDPLVKVGSETISNGKFYDQFFGLVERYLDDTSAGSGD
jgi:hypothetical protein